MRKNTSKVDLSVPRFILTAGGFAVMVEKRRRGRQPKPAEERQSVRFVVKVTPGDAAMLRADVAEAESTAGAFLTDLWRHWRDSREK
jgi:hypothetical protein